MKFKNFHAFITLGTLLLLTVGYLWLRLSSSTGCSGCCGVDTPVSFGYDTARDLSRVATALSFPCALFLGLWLLDRRRSLAIAMMLQKSISFQTVRRYMRNGVWQAIAMAILVPIGIHLAGTFAINNYGGLCGGL